MEISVALGGGGIKGITHIGVLDCLEKAGFHIHSIAGTSIGALIGSVYAAGYRPNEIVSLLESMNQNRLYSRTASDGPSLIGNAGLVEALAQVLGDCKFSDLKLPFACTAVDIRTAQEVYLNEGQVVDAVLASLAIPGVFPPKIYGQAELVDGGVLDPVPVNLARLLSPRLPVVAVALNPKQSEWDHIPEFNLTPPVSFPIPTPIIEGFARLRVGQSLRIFLHSMDITSRMLTEMRLEIDRPEVIIRPNVHQYGMLDQVNPDEVVEAGYRAAAAAIPEIRKSLSLTNRLLRSLRRPPARKDRARNGKTRLQAPPGKPE